MTSDCLLVQKWVRPKVLGDREVPPPEYENESLGGMCGTFTGLPFLAVLGWWQLKPKWAFNLFVLLRGASNLEIINEKRENFYPET